MEKHISPKFILTHDDTDHLFGKKNRVEILARDRYGKLLWVKSHSNIVVKIGRYAIARMLAEGTSNPLVEYAWGSGGHNPANEAEYIPATLDDTALNSEILRKPISSIQYPDPGIVKLIGIIEPPEIVDEKISEQGLFLQDHSLFARTTYPVLNKGAVQLEFRWTIHI